MGQTLTSPVDVDRVWELSWTDCRQGLAGWTLFASASRIGRRRSLRHHHNAQHFTGVHFVEGLSKCAMGVSPIYESALALSFDGIGARALTRLGLLGMRQCDCR